MNAPGHNIIKRQILDISIPSLEIEEEAISAVSKIYKEQIGGILDEVCAELIQDNEFIRIDALEVDIGRINFNKINIDFPRAVKHSIKEELYRQIRDGKAQSWVRPSKFNGTEKALERDADNDQQKNYSNFKERWESTFLHYLRTGLVPWYYEGGLSKMKGEFSKDLPLAKRVFQKHLSDHSETLRAVYFFDNEMIQSLLLKKYSNKTKGPLNDFEILKEILSKLSKSSQKKVSDEAQNLINALAPEKRLFVISIAQLLTARTNLKISNVIDAWPEKYRNQLNGLFQKEVVLGLADLNSEEKRNIKRFIGGEIKSKGNEKGDLVASEAESKDDASPKFNAKTQMPIGESISVNNAGLVIVWPYLQAFFTGLNLMKDRLFINDEMSTKAVHLLHYLVYKSETGDETMWFMNKLLSGLPESTYIPEFMDLSSEEKDECENLLAAIIKNWPALKNTSPDSLRNTFLQRDGILARNERGWVLKIERQAYDILLDRLNWTISTIKLPWNNYMIHTEW